MNIAFHHKYGGSSRGFTLLELMIVVVVVAILASIAYPSYVESVRKGRRAEARTALLELMQQQERYMTQNNTYMAFAAGATNTPFITTAGNSGRVTYNLSAEACSGLTINVCVNLKAVPVQEDPRAGWLSLTSTGVKDCEKSDKKICWP